MRTRCGQKKTPKRDNAQQNGRNTRTLRSKKYPQTQQCPKRHRYMCKLEQWGVTTFPPFAKPSTPHQDKFENDQRDTSFGKNGWMIILLQFKLCRFMATQSILNFKHDRFCTT